METWPERYAPTCTCSARDSVQTVHKEQVEAAETGSSDMLAALDTLRRHSALPVTSYRYNINVLFGAVNKITSTGTR